LSQGLNVKKYNIKMTGIAKRITSLLALSQCILAAEIGNTFEDIVGSTQMAIYGLMFEMHNLIEDKEVRIYQMDIHTIGTREDMVLEIYTSPGLLDYKRHPTAWDRRADAIFTGRGEDEMTPIMRDQFEIISILGGEVMSFYLTLSTREILTFVTTTPDETNIAMAMQNGDVGISFGLAKRYWFEELETGCVFSGTVKYTHSISFPPTLSPTVSHSPIISANPTEDIGINVQSQLLNITATFQGGVTNDGVMFDLRAKESVILYAMDILSPFLGVVNLEIYIRRNTWDGYETRPGAWSKIANFEIDGKGFGGTYFLNEIDINDLYSNFDQ